MKTWPMYQLPPEQLRLDMSLTRFNMIQKKKKPENFPTSFLPCPKLSTLPASYIFPFVFAFLSEIHLIPKFQFKTLWNPIVTFNQKVLKG
jgi:hypothetical protein